MGVHGQVIYVNPAKNLVIANFASPIQTANQLRPSYKQMLYGTRALALRFRPLWEPPQDWQMDWRHQPASHIGAVAIIVAAMKNQPSSATLPC